MSVKIYTSTCSGNLEIKKKQDFIIRILESKSIDYEEVDITSSEDAKQFMRSKAQASGDQRYPLPPQVFVGDTYCGDYESFNEANECDEVFEFLKMAPEKVKSEASMNVEEKISDKMNNNEQTTQNICCDVSKEGEVLVAANYSQAHSAPPNEAKSLKSAFIATNNLATSVAGVPNESAVNGSGKEKKSKKKQKKQKKTKKAKKGSGSSSSSSSSSSSDSSDDEDKSWQPHGGAHFDLELSITPANSRDEDYDADAGDQAPQSAHLDERGMEQLTEALMTASMEGGGDLEVPAETEEPVTDIRTNIDQFDSLMEADDLNIEMNAAEEVEAEIEAEIEEAEEEIEEVEAEVEENNEEVVED